jgi:outer membrane protein OmpA-like peptidoglycan-associated protein
MQNHTTGPLLSYLEIKCILSIKNRLMNHILNPRAKIFCCLQTGKLATQSYKGITVLLGLDAKSFNPVAKCLITALFLLSAFSCLNAQFVNKTDILTGFPTPVAYPAISPDGKHLVFLSDDGINKIVFESFLANGQWSNPAEITTLNEFKNRNPKPDIGGFSFNHDGSILFFHANISGNNDIFSTRIEKGKYGEPKNFGPPINSPSNEYSPSLSPDEKSFFLLRDKTGHDTKDGLCKDLVLYEKDNNNTWVGPGYLPAVFNSGCQETPFFCSDNSTLLFASQRPDTNKLGKDVKDWGFNLYYTQHLFENIWLIPQFVDDLNTEFDDLSPSMDYTGDYFCSNIKAKKLKNKPQGIFNTKLPPGVKPGNTLLLKGLITNLNTKQPVDANILVSNIITSSIEGEYSTMDSGKYSIILKKGIDYKIDYYMKDYSHFYYYVNTMSLITREVKEVNVTLYNEVNLDLNVFDKELYYPLHPTITITDSATNQPGGAVIKQTGNGRFSCKLLIGKKYKIHFENEHFEPYNEYFDLNTDVQYSAFEKDIEMQPSKQQLLLNVSDETGNDTISVSVDIKNLSRNEKTSVLAKRDKDGNLIVELREGDRYEIDVNKKGYTYYNTKVDAEKSNKSKKLDIKLDMLTTKTKIVFNNITFETNSADLNANSYEELTRLVKFMTDNPDIFIEVSAHTDDKGSDAYNINFSMKRAQSVVDYLSVQSIDKKRLKSKGYGKSMPLVPNTSDANRAKNRRVELKIIENPEKTN